MTVMCEEKYYQRGDKFISSHIYSVMPSTMPVVQENYSETIPDDTPATVQMHMKENQLFMTDFITFVKGKEKTPRKVDIVKKKYKQTSVEQFTLPKKKFKIANEWENKLHNEFSQMESNFEWMEDEEGDHSIENIVLKGNTGVFEGDMKAKEIFVPKMKETQNSLNLDGDLDCTKNQEVFEAKLKSQLQMIDCNSKETGEGQAAGDQAMVNLELLDWMQDTEGDIDCIEASEASKETEEVQAAGDQAIGNLELLDWMQDTEGDIDCLEASEASEGFETKLESQIFDNSPEDDEKRDKMNDDAIKATKADKSMVY